MRPANFRDVGEALGLWHDPPPVPLGRLLRGGKFDQLSTLEELGGPATILNLRRGPDPTHLPASIIHLPAPGEVENYDTRQRSVRTWLVSVLDVLAAPTTIWPVYVHCTSGRDRTGVVVAAALTALGVPRETVAEEYMLSEDTSREAIELALDGMMDHRALRSALRAAVGWIG